MGVDYPIIDGDGHVVEVDDDIRAYLPDQYRRIPENRVYSLFPMDAWSFGVNDKFKQDVPTAEMWLSFLDRAGISATVLYGSNALTHGLIRHVQWSIDLARAYNDWLYDRFCRHSDRLHGVALLPLQDPRAAGDELRRCVRDYGFVGGMIPSVASPLRALGSPEFDPLYAAAQEVDTMLAIHGGAIGGHTFAEPLQSYREVRTIKHMIPQMIQMTSMISQGVYDRFPELRVAYLEAGCGWVIPLMDSMGDQFARKGGPTLKKSPREYVESENIFFAAEPEEHALPLFIQLFGSQKLIWPSDYPHERPREEFFGDLPELFARQDLSDTTRRAILNESPQRLYRRLNVPATTVS
jgi:uncharacterized protein